MKIYSEKDRKAESNMRRMQSNCYKRDRLIGDLAQPDEKIEAGIDILGGSC